MVDVDVSGQPALQLTVDAPRRSREVSDESGGLAPGGAVSVSDRSLVSAFDIPSGVSDSRR